MGLDTDIVNKNNYFKKRPFIKFSSLTTTLYLIIFLPIIISLFGILYLDQYKKTLISNQLSSLIIQADTLSLIMSKLEQDSAKVVRRSLSRESVQLLMPLSGRGNNIRIRLFQPNGKLFADTRLMSKFSPKVEILRLPNLEKSKNIIYIIEQYIKNFLSKINLNNSYPIYFEDVNYSATKFEEVINSLNGSNSTMVRRDNNGNLILSAAVPIGNPRLIRGALMLSIEGNDIDDDVKELQFSFVNIFILVSILSLILGVIFSRRITYPIINLSKEADKITNSRGKIEINFKTYFQRNDEIGDLAKSLNKMTKNLWNRLDAIASFAADVSHELKNPLTSLRSAVETFHKIDDKAKQNKLLKIIELDVNRLDKLISDISAASKLDSDLYKDQMEKINLGKLVNGLISIKKTTFRYLKFKTSIKEDIFVWGNENRLIQILENLIGNAISFSPKNGVIHLYLEKSDNKVYLTIEDQGPGITKGKLTTIFERFYSERPKDESNRNHSGLGLSIVKQIVEAHNGEIIAENIIDKNKVIGSRFIMKINSLK